MFYGLVIIVSTLLHKVNSALIASTIIIIVLVTLTEVNIGRGSMIPDEPLTNIRSRVGIIDVPDIATHIAVDIIIIAKVLVVVVTLATF